MKILSRIKALFFAIEFLISIVFVVIFMAIFKNHQREIRKKWARIQRFFGFYKLEVINSPKEEANLLILNHQSILDIIVLEEIHPKNLCWIAKKEIENLPIIGKIISTPKMISVDRSNPKSLIKLLSDVKDRVENGRVISVFPEGTRGDGITLNKFKNGTKSIVSKLNLKVQAAVIVNSRKIMDSKKFSLNNGVVKVIYTDLIDTTDENWLSILQEQMQEILNKNL